MSVSAIIVAAGRGERIGEGIPKQFLSLNDTPIIFLSLSYFEQERMIDEMIVVTLPEWFSYLNKEAKRRGYKKLNRIVEGGDFRQDSFRNGLDVASGDIIIDHDAARPFPFTLDIRAMIEVCRRTGAVIPVVPVNDTIKQIREKRVEKTVDREGLFSVQTPQVFKSELLRMVYRDADNSSVTDTASLLERAGIPVSAMPGSVSNIKITTKDDITIANLLFNYLKSGDRC